MISADLLEKAIEASSEGFVIADARRKDNPLIYVNPGFERITGYRSDEVLNKNCRFLQGGDLQQPELETLRKAIRDGQSCLVKLRNYRKDGSLFWNELSLSTVQDETGAITHFIGVQKDITARVIAETELQESRQRLKKAMSFIEETNRSLAQRVADDTEELRQVHEALMESEKLAAIGQFAAGIVHEIRSPLNTLGMVLEYMQELDLPGSADKRLRLALDEHARLGRLLNEMLLYAKPHHLEMMEVDLCELVRTVLEVARETPACRSREVRFEACSLTSPVLGDRDKLHEALLNLICNACEASGEADIIDILVEGTQHNDRASIAVHNRGEVIPRENLSRLTEPFFTTKREGTGLGLAIVDRIVAAHGGELAFESSAETGTTARIELRAALGDKSRLPGQKSGRQ